ncbi:MAG: polysaccharide biosynthesis protein [Candidatus Xenobium sp.]|nr:polysaccharide biosynthesis protein [Burkholderiales bacterium]
MRLRFKLALAVVDFLLLMAGLLLALGLRLDFDQAAMGRFLTPNHLWFYGMASGLTVVAFFLFGLYEKVWRYAGIYELLAMVWAVTAVVVPIGVLILLAGGSFFPRTGPVIAAFLWLSLCGGLRFALRISSHRRVQRGDTYRRVLVVGANDAGEAVVRELIRQRTGLDPVGFLDGDPDRRRIRIHGVPVLGTPDQVADIARDYQVSEVILAQSDPAVVRTVVGACASTELQLRLVPSLSDVAGGHVTVNSIREVQIEDLLERDPVRVELASVGEYLRARRILVTGAGGSIGSEICRQVVHLGAESVIMMGRGENSIYEIALELRGEPVIPFIADTRDRGRLEELFRRHQPQVVFHAAAHKHVPLMEANPSEAVSNNIFGTALLMELAERHQVEKFISISTDKAVNPSSVMGASKRMVELLLARRAAPGFAAVRFGNVLGSRGSVIPTFRRQIAAGGPVTVTDADMTRYFMTIPEAVSLVIQAGALAQGGEIYILDMGSPVKIMDLARNMIRLSGYEPDLDIPILVTGVRPGEKLYEELVNTGEETESTRFPKITRVISPAPPPEWPGPELEDLRQAAAHSQDERCLELLARLVPRYERPSA